MFDIEHLAQETTALESNADLMSGCGFARGVCRVVRHCWFVKFAFLNLGARFDCYLVGIGAEVETVQQVLRYFDYGIAGTRPEARYPVNVFLS